MKKNKWFILLILAYIPMIFIPYINSSTYKIAGVPLLWYYFISWIIYVFILLLVSYYIDVKRR